MNTIIERINSKLVGKGEPVSDLEDRIVEITQSEEQSEKNNFRKIRTFLWDFWDNIRYTNICIIRVSEG